MSLILNIFISLIDNVAVILVIAFFLTRSALFKRVIENEMTWRDHLLLILIFGSFSIYGTIEGFSILKGIANFRDLGPTLAGLMAGPAAGLGAGIIGGLYRYSQGGFTALACSIAPVAAGLAGGAAYLINRRKFPGILQSVLLMIGIELFHLGITILLSHPRDDAIRLVRSFIIPMLSVNAAGIGIFAYIMVNLMVELSLKNNKLMMEGELRAARDIQMSLVPKSFASVPKGGGFSLHAYLEPAKEVGGDLYDFYYIDDNRFFFMIGDVSGKGIPAALFMAVIKTMMKAMMSHYKRPALLVSEVNRCLCEENDADMFVTVFCGFLDIRNGDVAYVNAGHNPPAVIRAQGSASLVRIISDPPLGISGNSSYSEGSLHLGPGDTLVLYTDGVTEARDRKGAFFTEAGLLDAIDGSAGRSAEDIVNSLRDEVHSFTTGAGQADDITILALKLRLLKDSEHIP
jgi:phosphoserine phosphatase RsbU/P